MLIIYYLLLATTVTINIFYDSVYSVMQYMQDVIILRDKQKTPGNLHSSFRKLMIIINTTSCVFMKYNKYLTNS